MNKLTLTHWQELTHGLYDGVTGIITQPMKGAKDTGAPGFLKGVGKGIGGVVLKPFAGRPPPPSPSIPSDTNQKLSRLLGSSRLPP